MFTQSEKFKQEYSCRIVKVGQVFPIEGADKVGYVNIGDSSLVVRKDQVNEGDIMVYAAMETELNSDFLRANNLYEWSNKELNGNIDAVNRKIQESETARISNDIEQANVLLEEAKRMVGYFGPNGRVRMTRIRKMPSMGYLFDFDELVKWNPNVKNYLNRVDAETLVDTFFDTVDGNLLCKAYIPKNSYTQGKGKRRDKRNEKLKRFDKLIPGEFLLHYDTNKLGDNMWRITPTTPVTISVKVHGTSDVIGNVKMKYPDPNTPWYKKVWNKFINTFNLPEKWHAIDYYIDYGNIYSSRSVIKNQYINKDVKEGYYGDGNGDVWTEYNEILKDYIPNGMTVYSEIYGYITGSQQMIQKGYDYGCPVGTNKIMPYRITTDTDEGKFEWNVSEVYEWTMKLLTDHPELKDRVEPIHILYNGTLGDLYPDLDVNNHWKENVLLAMMQDKEHFGMEENEPMCTIKAPREGIVLRINDDINAEAFKLKTQAFKDREAKLIDKGEVDIEMAAQA